MSVRIVLVAAALGALSACGRGASGENLGVANGNTLTHTEIDAALGPANQAESANSSMVENELALGNAASTERNGETRPLRRHQPGNAASAPR